MPFNPQNYQFTIGEHRDKNVVFAHFPFSQSLNDELKVKFPAVKWSVTNKCWYLPDTKSVRIEIGMTPKTEMGKAVIAQIHQVNLCALKRMHELLLLKAYSPSTIKTYCTEFSQLLYVLNDVHVDSLTPERLRSYLLYCTTVLKLSENLIHSRMNAIKFYFEQVLHRDKIFFTDIPRPRKKSILPKVIGKLDIAKIFAKVEN